jgi:hypothetical protein
MRYAQRAAPAGSGDHTGDAHDDTADGSGETVSAATYTV